METNWMSNSGVTAKREFEEYVGRPAERTVRYLNLSPDFRIDTLDCNGKRIHVVREDLLPGGTKQRAVVPYLRELESSGVKEVVYASPFSGFAQVALAVASSLLDLPCTLFCERDQTVKDRRVLHEFSELAKGFGARIVLVDSLEEAELRAKEYSSAGASRFQLPLGFDCDGYRKYLKRELAKGWFAVEKHLQKKADALWLPVGSGTLARTFAEVVDPNVAFHCVNVRVLSADDPRIAGVAKRMHSQLFETPERFHEPSITRPPIPSNAFYDAKLRRFLGEHATQDCVWWNVAR